MRFQLCALAWLAWGCSEPRTASSGEAGGPFPHSADFATTHGEDAAQLEGCSACHLLEPRPEDTAGDTAGDTSGDTAMDTAADPSPEDPDNPACRSCHEAYPHPPELRDTHGEIWLDDELRCTGCHGSAGDRDPTSGPVDTCIGCHASYPHPSNFASSREHGRAVVDRGGTTACGGCHEPDSCQTCHAAYPHSDDHLHSHGVGWSASTCGGNCHDGAQPGAPGELLCSDCHGEGSP